MKIFKKKQVDIPRRRVINPDSVKVSAQPDIFRRNRTLTGTTSNRFGAAIDNGASDLESPRKQAHHLTIHRRKVLSVLLMVIGVIIFLWLVLINFTAKASIGVLDLSVSKKIDSDRYEKVIQQYLDGNPLSRFQFFLDEPSLAAYVSSKLPEVSDVKQRGSVGIGETRFVINLRRPIAGWKIDDKQYYVDSKGIPFEQNNFIDPSVQIIDNSGISMQKGTAIASRRFLSFIGRVVSLSKESGYTVVQAILPENTARELVIKLKEGGYSIKLSIDRPVGTQVEDMGRAVKYFVARGQTPQYIDVRVSGKAFYK